MFLSTFASTDDRSPWGDFWFSPVTNRLASGGVLSDDQALRLTVVFSAVKILGESMAVCKPRLYKRKKKAGQKRQEIYDHWLLDMLRKPNAGQTGFEWIEQGQGFLGLRGNAYNFMTFNRDGSVKFAQPMSPARMRVIPTDEWGNVYKYTFKDGTQQTFSRAEIWHIKCQSVDNIVGLSPLACAREAIALGLSAQEYGSRFFQNDAKPSGGWIGLPGNFKDKKARDAFRSSWQESQSANNRHKTAILEYGMEYHEIGMTNKDSQFLEARQFSVTDIARIFRVPPHMLGDLSKATFANIEQQSLDFLVYCLTPWIERWKASIHGNLLLDDEADEYEIDFDMKAMLRADRTARSTFYHEGILDGWMTRNEAREDNGDEPIEGLDEPLVPLNVRGKDDPVPDAANDKTPPRNSENDSPPDSEQDDEPTTFEKKKREKKEKKKKDAARFARMIEGNAQRMARRIADDKTPSAYVLAEALAVDERAAANWIASHVAALDETATFNSLMQLATEG